jgi:hypothetical protein
LWLAAILKLPSLNLHDGNGPGRVNAIAGKTTAQTAAILGIGEATVEQHLKDSRARLGAANRVHTVVTAIRRREIPI